MSLAVDAESPDVNLAKQFLPYYFATAPQSPSVTWEQLTPAYKQAGAAKRDDPLDYNGYSAFFRKYSRIDADGVTVSDDNDGWYSADISYYALGEESKPSVSPQQFELQCPWFTKFPLLHCNAQNVKLNAAARMPPG